MSQKVYGRYTAILECWVYAYVYCQYQALSPPPSREPRYEAKVNFCYAAHKMHLFTNVWLGNHY